MNADVLSNCLEQAIPIVREAGKLLHDRVCSSSIQEKGCVARAFRTRHVDREFDRWQLADPIPLIRSDALSQHLRNSAIRSLSGTVGLRVIRTRHPEFRPDKFV